MEAEDDPGVRDHPIEVASGAPDEGELRAADLVRTEVELRVRRRHLRLLTAHDLFSGDAVDGGTTLLLRSVRKVLDAPEHATDLGCGYGPLGLWGAAAWPDAEVRLTDRDALAVAFSRVNAARNDLDVSVAPSLLLDGEAGERDLVMANVPGKAGPGVLHRLVAEALDRLAPGGHLAMVAVQPVAEVVAGAVVDLGGEVVHRHDNSTYAVILAASADERLRGAASGSPLTGDAYDRGPATVELDGLDDPIRLRAVHGLPEFESASYATLLAWELLRRTPATDLLVVNPGQGILPVAAGRRGAALHLVSRDLLQLHASRRALGDAGLPRGTALHAVPALDPVPPPADTAVVVCGRRDRAAEVAVLLGRLAGGGCARVVLAGRSRLVGDVGRTVRRARTWWVGEELDHHGAAAVELTPRGATGHGAASGPAAGTSTSLSG